MNKLEILGLILVMYELNPKASEKNVYIEYKGEQHYPYTLLVAPNDYLKRKGYMNEQGLTKKAHKLLNKYNCHIKQIEQR